MLLPNDNSSGKFIGAAFFLAVERGLCREAMLEALAPLNAQWRMEQMEPFVPKYFAFRSAGVSVYHNGANRFSVRIVASQAAPYQQRIVRASEAFDIARLAYKMDVSEAGVTPGSALGADKHNAVFRSGFFDPKRPVPLPDFGGMP
jgi:hypothetical protein